MNSLAFSKLLPQQTFTTRTPTHNVIGNQPALPRNCLVFAGNSAQDDSRRSGGEARRQTNNNRGRSAKSSNFEREKRRKGRPAHLRSPDDTPLRDGNRDRLMGLLTDRAARTLLFYLMELNPTTFGWFSRYLQAYPIPREGNWDDVSGETFLRNLLLRPIEGASWGNRIGLDPMYDGTGVMGVNPREIATRIIAIRSQIAAEWIEELKMVSEENSLLMRESLFSSFSLNSMDSDDDVKTSSGGGAVGIHPLEMLPDDSAIGGDD